MELAVKSDTTDDKSGCCEDGVAEDAGTGITVIVAGPLDGEGVGEGVGSRTEDKPANSPDEEGAADACAAEELGPVADGSSNEDNPASKPDEVAAGALLETAPD